MHFPDLHNHLYGSISAETLFEIGKRNPSPRWKIFTDLYKKLYGEEIDVNTFFSEYCDLNKFEKLYYFNKPAPFLEFQSKFNLIIALCKFDEEEISHIAKELVSSQPNLQVDFAEYRIMYSPMATKDVYFCKTIAACEGLRLGEIATQFKSQARLVVSLHRDGNYLEQYNWLKKMIQENDLVKKYLVGIDFCNIEEGFPPSEKKSFFEQVNKDNEAYPDSALSILYHVGESFADKTPKSSVRWVGESALYGAHRLGHCIVLGLNPEHFANKGISEKVSERLSQIEFEIQYFEILKSFGVTQEYSKLIKEKENLIGKDRDERISFKIDKEYIDELYTFQEFTMYLIRENTKSIIESCPTSNLLIGMLPNIQSHPIRRFVDRRLRVTIGSDDPGIFNTTLKKEYEYAGNAGLSTFELETIKTKSYEYTSEKLAGKIL